MSCTGSCSTDSGVRNPSTTASFVAPGAAAAEGAAVGAGVAGGGVAVVSRTADGSGAGGVRSTRRHPGPRAANSRQSRGVFIGAFLPRYVFSYFNFLFRHSAPL